MVSGVRSVSSGAVDVLRGPRRDGVGLGRGYVDLGELVLAITPAGAPRMPNGVESDTGVGAGVRVEVGEGRVLVGGRLLVDAPALGRVEVWDAVPTPHVRLHCARPFAPDPFELAGRGEGLTPLGDDLLCGYVAGLVLWHDRRAEAEEIAAIAGPRTTLLSATLLRHAARGELPEPAHALVERGDPEPLRGFGRTSGRALARGLALACGADRAGAVTVGA
jgi:hypothetical protein